MSHSRFHAPPAPDWKPPENPLVSVVTPSFNMCHYLELTIQSVLAQDYQHVEHIVQDAASQDGTLAMLEKYQGRVQWISEPDDGEPDGLNRALKRCTGDLILVLNADDILLPQACSWAVQQFRQYPQVAVIYGDQVNIDEMGQPISASYGPDPYDYERIFCVEGVIPAQAAFIRRDCLEDVGFYADASLDICPDHEMWVRIGQRFPMLHVSEMICHYRLHADARGQRRDQVVNMIRTKWLVTLRTIAEPQCPPTIRRMKRRARGGILRWASDVFWGNGQRWTALGLRIVAWFVYPWRIRLLSTAQGVSGKTSLVMGRSFSWLLESTYGWRSRLKLTRRHFLNGRFDKT